MRKSKRHRIQTIAREANQLEITIAAAGLSETEALLLWDAWAQGGPKAAARLLAKRITNPLGESGGPGLAIEDAAGRHAA